MKEAAAEVWTVPDDPETEELVEAARSHLSRALPAGERLATAAAASAFVACALALVLRLPDTRPEPGALLTIALVAGYAVAARIQFEVGFAVALPTQLVFVPMLFLLPLRFVPLYVAAGLLASKLPEYVRGSWHAGRAGLVLLNAWYSVGPVLVLAAASAPAPGFGRLPLLAAALGAQFAFDFAASAARAFPLGVSTRQLAKALAPAWAVDAALTPVGFALAYASWAHEYAFLLGLPLLGLLAYFAGERRRRIDSALELSHAYRGTALLLGDMVEADDAYTGLHSQDVVSLVVGVADRLGLDARTRRDAELAALLHDVGKVHVPNEIINKPGPLTAEERAVVEQHTIDGQAMLEKVGGLLGNVGLLVRSCHERWDGAGYPDGLAGEEIPVVSRIVCACDAYSAMTTDRPYRRALGREEAFAELRRCAGTQFDPAVVDALLEVAVARPALPLAA